MSLLKKWMNVSLTKKVIGGIILGIIAGIILGERASGLALAGNLWIRALKMGVHPMIFAMLVCAVGDTENLTILGKSSYRILVYYLATSAIAAAVGITVCTIMKPGVALLGMDFGETTMENTGFNVTEFFTSMIPDNFLSPIVNGSMMQLLVLAIVCGIGIALMKNPDDRKSILNFMNKLQLMCSGMLGLVVKITPYAVFCVMASVVGKYGSLIVGSLGHLMVTYLVAGICQYIFAYGLLLFIFTKIPLWKFVGTLAPMVSMAVATSSSVLCIENNIKVCDRWEVDQKISKFTIPLGATMNMDGAAMFYPLCIIFTSQALGIQLPLSQIIMMVLLATLVSSAGGGFAGGAMVKLTFMADIFGVPNVMLTLIASVFTVIDIFITVLNAGGDIAGTIIVDRLSRRDKEKAAKKAV